MMNPEDDHTTADDATDSQEAGTAATPEETGLAAVETTPDAEGELEKLRREHDALAERLLRVRAEFDNFRKRVERDRQQVVFDGQADLLAKLIATIDNLDHALKADTTYDTLYAGVELIQRDFLATLAKMGLTTHDPTGQPFDPNTDEALSHDHVPGYDDGTVVECFRKGYLFRDRLLRPALVRVARGAETTQNHTGSGNGDDNTSHFSN
jgi:molecular chaperone GrpE